MSGSLSTLNLAPHCPSPSGLAFVDGPRPSGRFGVAREAGAWEVHGPSGAVCPMRPEVRGPSVLVHRGLERFRPPSPMGFRGALRGTRVGGPGWRPTVWRCCRSPHGTLGGCAPIGTLCSGAGIPGLGFRPTNFLKGAWRQATRQTSAASRSSSQSTAESRSFSAPRGATWRRDGKSPRSNKARQD